jgi:hypothetical protein
MLALAHVFNLCSSSLTGRRRREGKTDMARRSPALPVLRLGALALLASVAACSQPQAPEPPAAPVAEAAPVLLGGDPLEPELHAPPAVMAEARRPGWGTMEPIPNPSEYAEAGRDNPPYRLIGPTLAEPVRQARRATPAVRVAARVRPTPVANRSRVHHVIMPGRRPAPPVG